MKYWLVPEFLGILICGFLGTSVLVKEFQSHSLANTSSVEDLWPRTQLNQDHKDRRDPFEPLKKGRSVDSFLRKPQPESPKIFSDSTITDPNFKLLGIIHGQYGRQAVIQVSLGERIFARPGQELVQSGWIIKAINAREVRLENPSSSISGPNLPQPRTFILSFPTPGKLG